MLPSSENGFMFVLTRVEKSTVFPFWFQRSIKASLQTDAVVCMSEMQSLLSTALIWEMQNTRKL